jgi:osmotically-inducible protein OsmY
MVNIQRESDKQLRDAVLRQFEWDPQVASNHLHVATANGVVVLTGFVHTYGERYAVERAAQAVRGVDAVVNEIEVRSTSLQARPITAVAEVIDDFLIVPSQASQ